MITSDSDFTPFGKRVNCGHTNTMQTTADFIAAATEFTTGMQHGHDHLKSGDLLFRVNIHRNTTSIILYGDTFVFVNDDLNVVAKTGKCFVNRVVDNFVDEMM